MPNGSLYCCDRCIYSSFLDGWCDIYQVRLGSDLGASMVCRTFRPKEHPEQVGVDLDPAIAALKPGVIYKVENVHGAPWSPKPWRALGFAAMERGRQAELKWTTDLFSKESRDGGLYGKMKARRSFCLPRKLKRENLFPPIRDDAYAFFDAHSIAWHAEGENHLLSSQAFCVNFLFPFSYPHSQLALVSLLRPVFQGIQRVLPIEAGRYVSFEWEAEKDYLKEYGYRKGKRGMLATYPDAVVRFEELGPSGTPQIHLVLMEWKYSERYDTRSRVRSSRGTDRVAIYQPLFDRNDCPLNKEWMAANDVEFADIFYEPFYQLFRQQFLAHELEQDPDFEADVVSALHVAPEGNQEIERVTSPGLRRHGDTVSEVWAKLLRDPSRSISISTEELYQGFSPEQFPELETWRLYMTTRYPCLAR